MASLSDILGGVGIAAQPLIQRRDQERELLASLVAQAPELASDPQIAQALRGSFIGAGVPQALTGLEGVQDQRQEEALELQRSQATDEALQRMQVTLANMGLPSDVSSVDEGLARIGAGVAEDRATNLIAASKAEEVRQAERDQDFEREKELNALQNAQKGAKGATTEDKLLNVISTMLNRGQDTDVDKPGAASFAAAQIDQLQAQAESQKDHLFMLHELARVLDTASIPGLSFLQGEPPSPQEVEELLQDPQWVADNQDKIQKAQNSVAVNVKSRDQILATSPLAEMARAIDDELATQFSALREERLVPERHLDPAHASLLQGGRAQVGEDLADEAALFRPGAESAGAPPGQVSTLFEASSPEIKAFIQSLPPSYSPVMQIIEAEYGHDPELALKQMQRALDRITERYLISLQGSE
jgi:hypothetical protein